MKMSVSYRQLKPEETRNEDSKSIVEQKNIAQKCYRCAVVTAVLLTLLLFLVLCQLFITPLFLGTSSRTAILPLTTNLCGDACTFVLVESIPEGMLYEDNSSVSPSIYQAWMKMIGEANSSVDIASFYWTLKNEDTNTSDPSALPGENILQELLKLPGKDVKVRVAVNNPSPQSIEDIQELENHGVLVQKIDLMKLTTGVLHTKFWIVDKKDIYIGSANMDWRSLTQVKELGAVIYNCSCLAQDLEKIFEAYWFLGLPNASIPSPWPPDFSTSYNKDTPLKIELNETLAYVYISSAPSSLCGEGRTKDLESILSIIDDAQSFVNVAVMNYSPTTEYSDPKRFWPEIDDHLRKATYERNVKVRLLISCWKHSQRSMFPFLKSLDSVWDRKSHLDIEVKIFVVPETEKQSEIPYARVNHNKYMVTDKVAYIGTSNWSGDYFLHTAGSAIIVNQTASKTAKVTVQQQLQAVFERDWNSNYSIRIHDMHYIRKVCHYA